MLTVDEIIQLLHLQPHREGGYYVQTYRAAEELTADTLPSRYSSARAHSTAIYYLLTPDTYSLFHRLQSDEIFHFYLGDPVTMLQLHPDGSGRHILLGAELHAGMRPQIVVPRDVWQGARLLPGGRYALLGCTVAPGFDYGDFELGERGDLLAAYPQFEPEILALTTATAFPENVV